MNRRYTEIEWSPPSWHPLWPRRYEVVVVRRGPDHITTVHLRPYLLGGEGNRIGQSGADGLCTYTYDVDHDGTAEDALAHATDLLSADLGHDR